jgi:hypothetical protein
MPKDVIGPRRGPFAAVIRCSAVADKANEKQWSRLMRYADERKLNSEPLDRFVKRKSGIDKCVARFSRRLGRDGANRSEKRLRRG